MGGCLVGWIPCVWSFFASSSRSIFCISKSSPQSESETRRRETNGQDGYRGQGGGGEDKELWEKYQRFVWYILLELKKTDFG